MRDPVPGRRTYGRRTILSSIFLVLGAGTPSALAQASFGPYQATAIVTGTDMRSRPAGFAQCMLEVLVKVTGDPGLADDPRAGELASRAAAYVTSFSYFDPLAKRRPHDDQGTYDRSYDLTVRFDPGRIDLALTLLGASPWNGKRPAIFPVLAVRGSDPPWKVDLLLTSGDPAAGAWRASLENSAVKYGVEVRLPTEQEMRAWEVSPGRPPSEWKVPQTESVVAVGSIDYRPEAMGWVGSWITRWKGAEYTTRVRGVSFDEAFDRLVRGAVLVASGRGRPD